MQLNLPDFNLKIKNENGKNYIFDILRKKYIQITPEEWVRQNLVHYLIDYLEYPKHLLAIEKQISVFKTIKRPDIIVFGKNFKPLMIVECKRPKIKITEQTLKQTINYFMELKADYFLLSNGLNHYCCKIKNNSCNFIKDIPKFDDL